MRYDVKIEPYSERYLALKLSSEQSSRYRLIRPAYPEEHTDTALVPREIVVRFCKSAYQPVVTLFRGASGRWVVDVAGMEVEQEPEFN